ncbi:MAG: FIST C-terminal domain-containing protein [Planctomycetes bacterium]|nr:FIST C-terminal domain-containing protein [Planctomycetota bacterium]MCB9902835.1 FIST C-terminal domain-containing protein [Planctomycetota bacterium]
MQVRHLPHASPTALAATATELGTGPGEMLAILVAEQDKPNLDEVVAALNETGVRYFGALFPGLILGNDSIETGAIVVRMRSAGEPLLVRGLDRTDFAVPEMAGIAGSAPGTHTAVVLVDGLTANVSRLLSELFGRLGNCVHYIGGGAGSLSLKQEPCVFSRDGAFQDAAVIGFIPRGSTLGVRHGWSQFHGPVVATRAAGNVIYELNWQNAFDVYRDALQQFVDEPITKHNIFQITKSFPFGIFKEGQEDVVRDPVAVDDDGGLICVGEVPENAVLNVLNGDSDSLIAAATLAARDCAPATGTVLHGAMIVDCVSRTIFLAERFAEELDAVQESLRKLDSQIPLWGMLSLGEISSHGEGYVEFFNKTIVTAVFHD